MEKNPIKQLLLSPYARHRNILFSKWFQLMSAKKGCVCIPGKVSLVLMSVRSFLIRSLAVSSSEPSGKARHFCKMQQRV